MATKGKNLVVVESPAKARAIQGYLGKDYVVIASMGHVLDLPKKGGVEIKPVKGKKGVYKFITSLEPIKGKEKVLKELKSKAKTAAKIFLAPDPDREGEAIAQHISTVIEHTDVQRVLFHEITKAAVLEAFKSPRKVDDKLVDAQQARRILDRIVGFDVSQLLWEKVARGLSAGRVQSVALRLLVEREREIRKFIAVEYWSITARLRKDGREFEAKLHQIDGKKVEIGDSKSAAAIVAAVKKEKLTVSKVTASERRRNPLPPYITSTLQQDASRRLGLPVGITMKIAQSLYEGVEIDGESTGLITYMRTDSVRVSATAVADAREYIGKKLGKEYLPETPRAYQSRKSAQEAHEAIRPTSVSMTPAKFAKLKIKTLDKKAVALYKLIWSRFVASQCEPAVYDSVSADLMAGNHLFRASGSTLKFAGFLKVFEDVASRSGDDEPGQDSSQALPKLVEGDRPDVNSIVPKQHFTEPPPRFSEATLVKALEEEGIGRPSTYASIIATLRNRQYTHVEKRRLAPTDLGMSVTDLLVASFPDIFNLRFTAGMENELDEIEEGKMNLQGVLNDFYKEFLRDYTTAVGTMPNLKAGVETEYVCPTCEKKMNLRYGKMGRFLACSGYPDCKQTFEVTESKDGKLLKLETPKFEEKCPRCAGEMNFKRSRFGAFLACQRYPECRGVIPLKRLEENKYEIEPVEKVLKACPLCQGEMEVKRSRFGRFLACMKYPDCKGASPYLLNVPCPMKGCKGEICERQGRGGAYYACTAYPECKFRHSGFPIKVECPVCKAPAMFRVKEELKCAHKECAGVRPDPAAAALSAEEAVDD